MDVDVDSYKYDGYLILRDVFSLAEIEEFRQKSKSWQGKPGDLLMKRDLAPLVWDNRIVEIACKLLGAQPVYFGFSSMNYGVTEQGGKWHRDNAERFDLTHADWQSPYTIIRFGIYMQDHTKYSGGLMLRPTSHRPECVNTNKIAWADTRPGDVAVWNMRMLHAGGATLLKDFKNTAVVPDLAEKLSKSDLVEIDMGERLAAFISYGIRDIHLDNYIKWLKTRDFMINLWAKSTVTDFARQQLAKAGVDLLEVKV